MIIKHAIYDLFFYANKKGPDGKPLPTKRDRSAGRWRVRIWDKETQKNLVPVLDFKKLGDAETHRDDMLLKLTQGKGIGGKIKFGVFAEQWRVSQKHSIKTRRQVKSLMNNHIVPYFEHRDMDTIRQLEIQAWVTGLGNNPDPKMRLSPNTVKVVYQHTRSIFLSAVINKHIAESPCVKIALPDPDSKVEALPAEFVKALIGEIPARYRGALQVGASAGLRIGEVFGIEQRHLGFMRHLGSQRFSGNMLEVSQQLIDVSGEPRHLAPPKTKSSNRTVPMSEGLTLALSRHMRDFPVREVAMEYRPRTGPSRTRTARLVFTNQYGNAVGRSAFDRVFARARARACEVYVAAAPNDEEREHRKGVVERVAAECTFHDLRHFYASMLISESGNSKMVQMFLGHKSIEETMNTYAHLFKQDDDLARRAVDRVLGDVLGLVNKLAS